MRETAMRIDLRRLRLATEFLGLFVAAPLTLAFGLPASAMFPALFGVTAVGLVLLWLTPGFSWNDLTRGWNRIDWRLVGLFAAATVAVAAAVVVALVPEAAFRLLRSNPAMMAAVALVYPFLSVLPQEIVFRPLFFRRYGEILPPLHPAIALNAALFSLAHLMYWHWVVAAMTFAGGLVFAWAYEARRNFPMAFVLHAVSGVIVFAMGLGVFFYSGNVERPF